jgi:uncharacterized protein (TIRG00374 family)
MTKPGRFSKVPQLLLSFGVSVALVVWLAYSIDWAQVWDALGHVRYGLIIPLTGLLIAHFVIRAIRWNFLLPPPAQGTRVPLMTRFDAILVGAFATFILPLRAGELVRPLMLSRQTSYPFGVTFASVVIERFFDLSMVLVSFGLMLPHIPGVPSWVEHGAFLLTVLAGALLVFLIVGGLFPEPLGALIERCGAPLPTRLGQPLLRFARGLLAATAVLRSPTRLVAIVCLSALVWISSYLLSWGYLWLFGIEGSVSFAVAIGVIIALAVAAPSAPGFIGVYQTACLAAFALFAYSEETAIAYSLVSHAHQYVAFVAYGIWVMFKYNLSFRELRGGSSTSRA